MREPSKCDSDTVQSSKILDQPKVKRRSQVRFSDRLEMPGISRESVAVPTGKSKPLASVLKKSLTVSETVIVPSDTDITYLDLNTVTSTSPASEQMVYQETMEHVKFIDSLVRSHLRGEKDQMEAAVEQPPPRLQVTEEIVAERPSSDLCIETCTMRESKQLEYQNTVQHMERAHMEQFPAGFEILKESVSEKLSECSSGGIYRRTRSRLCKLTEEKSEGIKQTVGVPLDSDQLVFDLSELFSESSENGSQSSQVLDVRIRATETSPHPVQSINTGPETVNIGEPDLVEQVLTQPVMATSEGAALIVSEAEMVTNDGSIFQRTRSRLKSYLGSGESARQDPK